MILIHPACHWQRVRALLRDGSRICNRRTRSGHNYLVIS